MLWKKAKENIMDGTFLYSKMPEVSVKGVTPIYFKRGEDSYAWDLNDDKYLDLSIGLGPCILGYNNKEVNAAVIKQLNDGIIFSLPHPIEVEAAERLNEITNDDGYVRFLKSGAEANLAALRIARAYTGRDIIISGDYHGWHDWTIANTSRAAGIPQFNQGLIYQAEYNNIASYRELFERYKGQVAAIILEPIVFNLPKDDFLNKLIQLAHDEGALVIFDEVVTGFRYCIGGAQKYLNAFPDITTYGKAIANGFPLAAVVGKKEIIEKVKDNIFISSTYGGECLSLAAFIANIKFMRDNNVHEHIYQMGKNIKDGINQICQLRGSSIRCIGEPARLNFEFNNSQGVYSLEIKTLFLQELIKRKIYYVWNLLPNYSMNNKDVDFLLDKIDEIVHLIVLAEKSGQMDNLIHGMKPITVV